MTVYNLAGSDLSILLGREPFQAEIPDRSRLEIGVSPSEDEYRHLCTLLRSSDPRNVFEFGTCIGGSTRILAKNAPEATIYTLDLGEKSPEFVERHEAWLRDLALREKALLSAGLPNVRHLYGDSRTFDFSKIPPCDFIFIDGGHDYETVKSDSKNAMGLLNQENPNAVIAWHDCAPFTQDVSNLTFELAENHRIFGILETTLRFYVRRTLLEDRLDLVEERDPSLVLRVGSDASPATPGPRGA